MYPMFFFWFLMYCTFPHRVWHSRLLLCCTHYVKPFADTFLFFFRDVLCCFCEWERSRRTHVSRHGLRVETWPAFIPNDRSKKRLIQDTEDWQPRTGTTQSLLFSESWPSSQALTSVSQTRSRPQPVSAVYASQSSCVFSFGVFQHKLICVNGFFLWKDHFSESQYFVK